MDPITHHCPLCNNLLNPGDAFCNACGASVQKPPTEPEKSGEASSRQSGPPVMVPQATASEPAVPPPAPVGPSVQPPVDVPASTAAPLPLTEKLPPQPPAAPQVYSPQAPPPAVQPPTTPPRPDMPASAPPPPAASVYPPQPAPQPAPQTQPGYGAPPPPVQPGYGAAPAQVPPPGGGQGGYGAAPGAYSPGPYGAYSQTTPPPKKRNTALIAIIAIVSAVVVVGGIALFMLYGPPATARREAQIQAEYQELLTTICNSSSTQALVNHRSKLDTFSNSNPGVVDTDLERLMTACEDYEYGNRDDKETFLSMIRNLERLENSSVSEIAYCASSLLPDVNDEYDDYLTSVEDPDTSGTEPDEPSGPPASDPFQSPIPFSNMDDFCVIEDEYYYFEFVNTSGKTIDYLECWIFCYDENGNPMSGDAIDVGFENVEWEVDYPYILDGGDYTPEEFGYFEFYRCPGTAYAIPFVNYIEFTDGSYWGITDYVADMDDVFYQLELVKAQADAFAQTSIPA